jgi:hypothetical protein
VAPALVLGAALLVLASGCQRWRAAGAAPGEGGFTPSARATAPARATADGAAWTIEPTADGTAAIRYQGAQIASFRDAFWGQNWGWADPTLQPPTGPTKDGTFDVVVAPLGLTLHGAVRPGKGELTFTYTVEAARAVSNVHGGGLEFNLKLDSPLLAGTDTDVSLLPGNTGFVWRVPGGQELSASFDQPLVGAHFEMGNKGQIRLLFAADEVKPGKLTRTLTIRLPPGGVVRPSLDQRFGVRVAPDWAKDTLPWNKLPVDVSFLNDGDRPAGRHGRLRAQGDRLVFQDGTVGRFWGANVTAYSLFNGAREQVALQAKRLAALGYNLIRIHHHDSDWVNPNVFAPGDNTQTLNAEALDRIDWWVKCLRDEGIYVWLDLKVGRTFRPGDGIPGFEELAKWEKSGRGFDYVSPRLYELQRKFWEQYLNRTNPYTKLSYLEDPAVVAALVTNEDDLAGHFAILMLGDHKNPVHQRMIDGLMEASAKKLKLSMDEVGRYWEPGPGKLALADLEARFFRQAIGDLRRLRFGGLVTGTSFWGGEPLFSLPSLGVGDFIDVHSYGAAESLSANPRYEANFIAWIGAAQLPGKPLAISEWNVPFPIRDRFTAPLYVASIASLQGWDAPVIFAYMQEEVDEPDRASEWSSWFDPALSAVMPAAAVLFRQQHVKPAIKTYRFEPDRALLYGTALSPDTSATLRTVVEQSRLVVVPPDIPELDWDDGYGAKAGGDKPDPNTIVVTAADRDFIPAGQTKVRSDTGELERDWEAGTQTIDTPRTQAATGWVGGRKVALHDVELRIDTPAAAVALTSLDGRPIASSARILVTVAAQAVASDRDNHPPFLSQPVTGAFALRAAKPPEMTPIYPVDPGAPPARPAGKPVRGTREGDRYLFKLPPAAATHWFLLRPAGSKN